MWCDVLLLRLDFFLLNISNYIRIYNLLCSHGSLNRVKGKKQMIAIDWKFENILEIWLRFIGILF